MPRVVELTGQVKLLMVELSGADCIPGTLWQQIHEDPLGCDMTVLSVRRIRIPLIRMFLESCTPIIYFSPAAE